MEGRYDFRGLNCAGVGGIVWLAGPLPAPQPPAVRPTPFKTFLQGKARRCKKMVRRDGAGPARLRLVECGECARYNRVMDYERFVLSVEQLAKLAELLKMVMANQHGTIQIRVVNGKPSFISYTLEERF